MSSPSAYSNNSFKNANIYYEDTVYFKIVYFDRDLQKISYSNFEIYIFSVCSFLLLGAEQSSGKQKNAKLVFC